MTPTPEQVAQWARELGFNASVGPTDKNGKYTPHKNALALSVPIEWLQRICTASYNAGRIAQAEQDAKLCESRVMGDHNREDQEAERCAAAIRANAPKAGT